MIKIKAFVQRMEGKFVEVGCNSPLVRRYLSENELFKVGRIIGKATLVIGRIFGFMFLVWFLNYLSGKYGFESAVLLALVIIIFSFNKD